MGTVYEATHTVMERSVAIKVLHTLDAAGIKRFEREARALSAIEHSAIPELYGWGLTPDSRPYLVMEFIDLPPLTELIGKNSTLPPETVRQIAIAACDALSAIHGAGLVHRDIKPSNLMVQALSSGNPIVKVTDLGIARATSVMGSTTQTQSVVGSIDYMSPEHYRPKLLDARSDLFSLGCVLYRCLAGHAPYEAETALATALKMQEDERAPLPNTVPAYLRNAIDRCLAVDPMQRFESAADFKEALLSESSVPLSRVSPQKSRSWRSHQLKWLTLIAVLVVVPICCLGLSYWQEKQDQPKFTSNPLYKESQAVPYKNDELCELPWIEARYPDKRKVAAILHLRYQDNLANGRISRALAQHRQLGTYLRKQGLLAESDRELTAAVKEALDNNELETIALAKTQIELGKTAFLEKNYPLAEEMLNKGLNILQHQEPTGETMAEGALQRAQLHELVGDRLSSAATDYETAMRLFHHAKSATNKEMSSLEGLVRIKKRLGDNNGLSGLQQRLQQLKQIQHHYLILQKASLHTLNDVDQLPPLSDMIAAVAYFRTVETRRKSGALAWLCIRIAQTYALQGNRTDSIKWYQVAAEYADQAPIKIVRFANLKFCLQSLVQLDYSKTPELAEQISELLNTPDPSSYTSDDRVPAGEYREYGLILVDMMNKKISGARPLIARLADSAKQRSLSPQGSGLPVQERLIYIDCFLELKRSLGQAKDCLPFLEQALPLVSQARAKTWNENPAELSRFWQDASEVYSATGQMDKAVEASRTGYNLNRGALHRFAKAVTARHLADKLKQAGRTSDRTSEIKQLLLESREETRQMLAEAKTAFEKQRLIGYTDWSCYALASYYIETGNYENARKICAEQEKIWKEFGAKDAQTRDIKKLIDSLPSHRTTAPAPSRGANTIH